MSGKKDKESRRLTESVNKTMKKHLNDIEDAKKIDHARVLAVYNKHLRAMPIRQKLRFAMSLFFLETYNGMKHKCLTYILFWK